MLLINTSLSEFILEQKPDIEKEVKMIQSRIRIFYRKHGGQLIFSSGEIGTISNSDFKETDEIPLSTKNDLASFMNISSPQNTSAISYIVSPRKTFRCNWRHNHRPIYQLLCSGDVSRRTHTCSQPQKKRTVSQGAGIVTSHASQLGANVTFLSLTGKDKARNFATSILDKYDVNYSFNEDTALLPTVKQRFRSQENLYYG